MPRPIIFLHATNGCTVESGHAAVAATTAPSGRPRGGGGDPVSGSSSFQSTPGGDYGGGQSMSRTAVL